MVKNLDELFDRKLINQKAVEKWKNKRVLSLMINHGCSLMCSYCVSNCWNVKAIAKKKNIIDEMGITEYLNRIEKLFTKTLPHIVKIPGMEPSESPYFIPIMKKFYDMGVARIIIQSNLHGSKNLERFARQYPKEDIFKRVSLVASYHLGTYLDRGEKGVKMRNKWLHEHFPRVVKCGYKIDTIITPMTPKCIFDENIVKDYKHMQRFQNFKPMIAELVHFYEGKTYPDAYTKEETEGLTKVLKQLGVSVFDRGGSLGKNKVSEQKSEQMKYLTHYLKLKNRMCYMSSNFVGILADGLIRHCSAYNLGNLRDVTVKDTEGIYDNGSKCPSKKCGCKSSGSGYCLHAHSISLQEYYQAYYNQEGKPDIAKLFESD